MSEARTCAVVERGAPNSVAEHSWLALVGLHDRNKRPVSKRPVGATFDRGDGQCQMAAHLCRRILRYLAG